MYEPDSEESSLYADLTSSINNSAPDTETDGTITPTPTKRIKKFSDVSDASSGERTKTFFRDMDKNDSLSLTESEYFTAQSGFTTDSINSSSIWK